MPDFQSRHAGETIDDAVDVALNLSSGLGPRSLHSAPGPFTGYEDAAITLVSGDAEATTNGFDLADLLTDFGPDGYVDFLILVGGVWTPLQLTADGVVDPAVGYDPYAGPSGTYDVYRFRGSDSNGAASRAEGEGTLSEGFASHAEGEITVASGRGSHSEGLSTTASGDQSHAEGNETEASGGSSHAEGAFSKSLGTASHAGGWYGKAKKGWAHGHITQVPTQSVIVGGSAFAHNAFPAVIDSATLEIDPDTLFRFEGQVIARRLADDGTIQTGAFSGVVYRGAAGAPALTHETVTWDGGDDAEGELVISIVGNDLTFTVTNANATARTWAVHMMGLMLFSA